jgi:anaerobic magnesium-protoporphyrin IX monomethyl ester cyclase
LIIDGRTDIIAGVNILLINPPYALPFIREGRCQSPQSYRKNSVPQMTLAYLAGLLEREGHKIKVYDCIASGLGDSELFEDAAGFRPALAFINTTTPTIGSDLAFAAGLKKRFPGMALAVFGPHVTILHEEIMASSPFLDVAIRGEPEWAAVEIAGNAGGGGLGAQVLGCTTRTKNGVTVWPERRPEEDLDRFGFPDWRNLPIGEYVHPVFRKPYLMVNTGRGCRHRCIFCVAPKYYGTAVRHRSPSSVVEEIRAAVGGFGVRHFWFYADDFTESPAFVKDLCRSIVEARLDIVWWSNTRADKPDPDMFCWMRKSGCVMLSIGGESGSPEMLRRMRKGARVEDLKGTVRVLRRAGIDSLVYFLIGLPGETQATIRETIRQAKKVNSDYVEFYPATPYPGTELFRIASEEGWIAGEDWARFRYDDPAVSLPGLPPDRLKECIRSAYRGFYLRPRYLLVLLKRARRPAEFARLLRFGWGYFRRLLG